MVSVLVDVKDIFIIESLNILPLETTNSCLCHIPKAFTFSLLFTQEFEDVSR